jgi:hypothetical protein
MGVQLAFIFLDITRILMTFAGIQNWEIFSHQENQVQKASFNP